MFYKLRVSSYFYIVTAIILLTGRVEYSQSNGFENIFFSDAKNAFSIGVSTIEQPFKFSKNDWLTVATITGVTGILFTVDKNIREFALSNQSNFNDNLFSIDEFYGSKYTLLFTAGIYGVGLFAKNNSLRELGLHASEALIISGIITSVFKISLGRRRPYAGESQFFFKPFQFSNDKYQSLPSGHTTIAFAVSTVIANYRQNIIWKSFWYGAAGLTGLARIYHNKHWASDVLLGASIGYFTGKFVLFLNSNSPKQFASITVFPSVSDNSIGFNLSIKF